MPGQTGGLTRRIAKAAPVLPGRLLLVIEDLSVSLTLASSPDRGAIGRPVRLVQICLRLSVLEAAVRCYIGEVAAYTRGDWIMAQEKRDYYEVLGVSKTATDAEIKKLTASWP